LSKYRYDDLFYPFALICNVIAVAIVLYALQQAKLLPSHYYNYTHSKGSSSTESGKVIEIMFGLKIEDKLSAKVAQQLLSNKT
jgi:hypothetical protein